MEQMGDEFLNETMCFYSMPPSPARNSYDYEDANSRFFDFEFETSRRFNVSVVADDDSTENNGGDQSFPGKQQHNNKESLPAMAFADQLFSNGKVMPLLKPPPRFQYSNGDIGSSSCLSPPRFPFARRSLWNDDFDPFMAALESVKDENRERVHRRARSLSPSRALSPRQLENENENENQNQNQNENGQVVMMGDNKNGEDKAPIRVAEPKGVLLARHARQLAKMGNEKPSCKEGVREKKRKKIKRFLLKSASITMGKGSKIHEHEDKPKDESEALPKSKLKRSFTRKLSFRSKGLAQYNEESRVSQALIQYRPKLFLCMGYGSK